MAKPSSSTVMSRGSPACSTTRLDGALQASVRLVLLPCKQPGVAATEANRSVLQNAVPQRAACMYHGASPRPSTFAAVASIPLPPLLLAAAGESVSLREGLAAEIELERESWEDEMRQMRVGFGMRLRQTCVAPPVGPMHCRSGCAWISETCVGLVAPHALLANHSSHGDPLCAAPQAALDEAVQEREALAAQRVGLADQLEAALAQQQAAEERAEALRAELSQLTGQRNDLEKEVRSGGRTPAMPPPPSRRCCGPSIANWPAAPYGVRGLGQVMQRCLLPLSSCTMPTHHLCCVLHTPPQPPQIVLAAGRRARAEEDAEEVRFELSRRDQALAEARDSLSAAAAAQAQAEEEAASARALLAKRVQELEAGLQEAQALAPVRSELQARLAEALAGVEEREAALEELAQRLQDGAERIVAMERQAAESGALLQERERELQVCAVDWCIGLLPGS